jgi:hypothetical protein
MGTLIYPSPDVRPHPGRLLTGGSCARSGRSFVCLSAPARPWAGPLVSGRWRRRGLWRWRRDGDSGGSDGARRSKAARRAKMYRHSFIRVVMGGIRRLGRRAAMLESESGCVRHLIGKRDGWLRQQRRAGRPVTKLAVTMAGSRNLKLEGRMSCGESPAHPAHKGGLCSTSRPLSPGRRERSSRPVPPSPAWSDYNERLEAAPRLRTAHRFQLAGRALLHAANLARRDAEDPCEQVVCRGRLNSMPTSLNSLLEPSAVWSRRDCTRSLPAAL